MSSTKNVTIYLYGKKYSVPETLTIIKAIEYCGYEMTSGIGCRHGFCGACSVIYRIPDDHQLHYCLACETLVQDNMYIATLPFFPVAHPVYDVDKVDASQQIMMQLYPEIYSCVSCRSCSNACPRGLDVMGYVQDCQNGDFKAAAEKSFDCVMCHICASRCPASISQPEVAMLARRLYGKYVAPEAQHLVQRVDEVKRGTLLKDVQNLMEMSDEQLQQLYNSREIEK